MTRKRIKALLAAAVLTLALTACAGGGGKDGDPLAAAFANMDAAASMDMSMRMEMDMESGGETLESVTAMEMSMFTDPMRMKLDLSMDMGAYGSGGMSVYAEEDGSGGYTMYLYDGTSWYAQPATEADLDEYNLCGNMTGYMDSVSSLTQSGIEQVDGVSAYKYTGVISGQAVEDVMKESGALNSLADADMDERELEEMLSGLGDIEVALWISEEELYPIRYEMDMTAIMDGLMKNMMPAVDGGDAGISIPNMKITMTCSNFNSAADFTIPDEAKA